MRRLSWLCALLLAWLPLSTALAQTDSSRPSVTRPKKKTTKKKRAGKTKPKPPLAPVEEPAAAPTDAPVDEGPQWETVEEEPPEAPPAKVVAPSLVPEKKKQKQQQEALDQVRLDEQVKLRRTLLTAHQALGIATWAALAGTTVIGQLELNDKYRLGSPTPDRFELLHFGLAMGSTGLFAATGLFALLAPRPYELRSGFSTSTLHRILVGIATAGMLAQVGLGLYAHRLEGALDQRVVAQAHQIIGYGTLGALTVAAAVLVF